MKCPEGRRCSWCGTPGKCARRDELEKVAEHEMRVEVAQHDPAEIAAMSRLHEADALGHVADLEGRYSFVTILPCGCTFDGPGCEECA